MTKQEYARIYYIDHKEKILERCSNRYLENKDALREQGRKYYAANRDEASLRAKKNYEQATVLFSKLKSKGCSVCGYNSCLSALEFHHLDPSKKEHKLSQIRSEKTILRETAKCILVCANCHREIHAGIIHNFQPLLQVVNE